MREREEVAEAIGKYILVVEWLPQLSLDLLGGGSGGKVSKFFLFIQVVMEWNLKPIFSLTVVNCIFHSSYNTVMFSYLYSISSSC